MPIVSSTFDLDSVEWRRIADASNPELEINFEYSLLGYDLDAGRLDMLLRLEKNCYCRRHRHIAATVTMVLEGEQHVTETAPDGSTKTVVRKQGDYAMAAADALPHLERGGAEGGTVLLSMHAPDGVLFEYFDENMENSWTLSIEEYVKSWNNGSVHGAVPPSKNSSAAA